MVCIVQSVWYNSTVQHSNVQYNTIQYCVLMYYKIYTVQYSWTSPPAAEGRGGAERRRVFSVFSLSCICLSVCMSGFLLSPPPPPHSPQPPLSPSFILLFPMKFIHKIYSVKASIFTTYEWTHTLLPLPPHTPQPPISPLFILLSPIKFIHKIYSFDGLNS